MGTTGAYLNFLFRGLLDKTDEFARFSKENEK